MIDKTDVVVAIGIMAAIIIAIATGLILLMEGT